ncbi:hypothetical protein [Chryseobacterium sp. c4a]|uniref:hypothetical protein n=1 Tax=Chryseobacterium sp. c4a TaxID=1573582 RepID=UPI0013579561|nr:hypothetical protein [Chryseobacterium sp. c4a]
MKKLLFVAVLLTGTTLGFANTLASDIINTKSNSLKSEKTVKSQTKKAVLSKNKSKTNAKAKAAWFSDCRTVKVTCTSAYTCQDWSENQWNSWGSSIQTNYCMYDSPYTP